MEQESVYRDLESLDSAIPRWSLFPDDICSSAPHSVGCGYIAMPKTTNPETEFNLNGLLQSLIEDCLFESVNDARRLFDIMSTALLPPASIVARATTGSMIILAHMIVVASVAANSQRLFPEDLRLQLLKPMLHSDVSGHQIFVVLLILNLNHFKQDASYQTRRWSSDTASVFALVTSLLDKLRGDKNGTEIKKRDISIQEGENTEAERNHRFAHKKSPNFQKISSVTAGEMILSDAEPSVLKFSEDQLTQLLSPFWIQSNLPDNTLPNIEALAYSFHLILISLRLKDPNDNLVVRFFQLPNVADIFKPMLKSDVDDYLGISGDSQVGIKPQADIKDYCSDHDSRVAAALLFDLQSKMIISYEMIIDILVHKLATLSRNRVTGTLPDNVSSLKKPRIFYLSQNGLEGNFPAAIGELQNLIRRDLSLKLFSNIAASMTGLNMKIVPSLSLQDIPEKHNPFPFEVGNITEVNVLQHDLCTIAALYITTVFDMSSLKQELLSIIPLDMVGDRCVDC